MGSLPWSNGHSLCRLGAHLMQGRGHRTCARAGWLSRGACGRGLPVALAGVAWARGRGLCTPRGGRNTCCARCRVSHMRVFATSLRDASRRVAKPTSPTVRSIMQLKLHHGSHHARAPGVTFARAVGLGGAGGGVAWLPVAAGRGAGGHGAGTSCDPWALRPRLARGVLLGAGVHAVRGDLRAARRPQHAEVLALRLHDQAQPPQHLVQLGELGRCMENIKAWGRGRDAGGFLVSRLSPFPSVFTIVERTTFPRTRH
eukprot:gene6856-biopygen23948